MATKKAPARRPRYAMPAFIRTALSGAGLMEAYKQRPPYQRNDYILWITKAKLESTKDKRLKQMIAELSKGNSYMKMPWKPRLR